MPFWEVLRDQAKLWRQAIQLRQHHRALREGLAVAHQIGTLYLPITGAVQEALVLGTVTLPLVKMTAHCVATQCHVRYNHPLAPPDCLPCSCQSLGGKTVSPQDSERIQVRGARSRTTVDQSTVTVLDHSANPSVTESLTVSWIEHGISWRRARLTAPSSARARLPPSLPRCQRRSSLANGLQPPSRSPQRSRQHGL